jgi:DNA-binding transcriptional regulator YiaG
MRKRSVRTETTKPRKRRKSRKPTGKWANAVVELRKAISIAEGEPYSQRDFATFFNVAGVTTARWEIGMQDPPAPKRKHLSLIADLYGRRDLAVAFASELESDSPIPKKERAILGLLACLFQWERLGDEGASHNDSIHSAAKKVFDVACQIVANARSGTRNVSAGETFLATEMERRITEIFAEEETLNAFFSRKAGMRMFTPERKILK